MTPKIHRKTVSEIDSQATGAVMRAYRQQHGLTQDDLAKKLGVSRVSILHRETGQSAITEASFEEYINAVNQLK